MDYYSHMQHVQHKQQEAAQKYREREYRAIVLEKNRRKRKPKKSFSLWCIIRAWFTAHRKRKNSDKARQTLIGHLQLQDECCAN